MILGFEPVTADDFESLLTLRGEAIRESLERLSRYDPQRSRERFLASFSPKHMRHILRDDERVGFMTVKPVDGALHVDHLYLRGGDQGQGIGGWALAHAKHEAQRQGVALTLSALKLSDANRFYQRCGFVQTGEQEFDIQYRWSALP